MTTYTITQTDAIAYARTLQGGGMGRADRYAAADLIAERFELSSLELRAVLNAVWGPAVNLASNDLSPYRGGK